MKKKLIALLPLLFLVGCAQTEVGASSAEYVLTYENELPVVHKDNSNYITYLKLSPYGRLSVDGSLVAGIDIPEMFYENCVAYEAAAGSTLPVAVSTLDDVVFRGWYQYNNNIFPDKIEKVPTTSGQCLTAIFDGPTGGSGGEATSGFGIIFSDGTKVCGVKGEESEGFQQYVIYGQSFTQGQSFSLYDFSTGGKWVVDINAYSFGDANGTGTNWKNYLSKGTDSYTVLKEFTADMYLKIKMGEDNVYFGLA